jgi:chromosome segregation ATPase
MQTIRRREQEVWQACDDLWAIHGNISGLTGDAIRERLILLGKSRGSPNEIYKYRKTWEEIRGINKAQENSSDLSDPISRAVKLVHEQLQSEANEQLQKIKEEFLILLKAKEEENIKIKEDLSNLVKEYSVLDQKNLVQEENIANLQTNLKIEQEEKKNYEQKTQDLDKHLNTSISNHAEELLRLKQAYESMIISLNAQNNKLEEDKTILGHNFSEQLTQLKVEIYNLKINLQKEEKEKEELAIKNLNLSNKNQEYLKETQNLITANQSILVEVKEKNQQIKNHKEELIKANNNLKASIVTIARLRAILK